MKKLTDKLSLLKIKAGIKLESMWNDQRGETNIIAIILILVVVIALVVLFRDAITDLFETIWDAITKDAEDVLK